MNDDPKAPLTDVNAATDDGRAVTVAVTELPTAQAQVDHLTAAVDTALCH
jgi:hypothetical protein